MRLELVGADALRKELKKLSKRYPKALAAGLYQEGLALHANAVKRAPVQYGFLRASGYTSPPTGEGSPVVEVGFGANYALAQHEGVGFKHPKGGEAKYLQNAILERSSGFLERLVKRTQENEAKGVGVQAIPATAPRRPSDGGRNRHERRKEKAEARAQLKANRAEGRAHRKGLATEAKASAKASAKARAAKLKALRKGAGKRAKALRKGAKAAVKGVRKGLKKRIKSLTKKRRKPKKKS
jgi:hypothetical protein